MENDAIFSLLKKAFLEAVLDFPNQILSAELPDTILYGGLFPRMTFLSDATQ